MHLAGPDVFGPLRRSGGKVSQKMKRIARYLLLAVLLWLLFLVLSMVIPPLVHKTAGPGDWEAEPEMTDAAPERVRSIDDNQDALLWRLRLIEAAQEQIILATFDFWDEEGGRDVMGALWNAAERGVEVQVLVDGLNGGGRPLSSSDLFCQLAAHENVEVRLYNPLNLLTPWKTNYRMHDKYLIADDLAYLLGGRNTDNRFLGRYTDHYNVDRDILVYETEPGQGQSYRQLRDYFHRIWSLPCCKVLDQPGEGEDLSRCYEETRARYPQAFADPLTRPEWEAATLETQGVELWTNPIEPENKKPILWARMMDAMAKAEEVLVQTPYIICSRDMYGDLRSVCDSGTRTDILINAVEIGSNPFGCTDYLNQKKPLRDTGVSMYEYLGDQALHTKSLVVGDDLTIAGSCNFDMRSVYLDTELMLAIRSPQLNAQIRGQIQELQEHSRRMAPDGTITDGPAYQPREQSLGKQISYGLLRAVILPFRHLL